MSAFLDYRDHAELVPLIEGCLAQWKTLRQEAVDVLELFVPSPEVNIQDPNDIRLFILPLKWQGKTVGWAGPGVDDIARNPQVVSAMFSMSVPGCELTPHIDNEEWIGPVWRIHVGLDCPEDCALQVDGQVQAWRNGQALMFDSARVEHSAWNRGSKPRLILILDVKR